MPQIGTDEIEVSQKEVAYGNRLASFHLKLRQSQQASAGYDPRAVAKSNDLPGVTCLYAFLFYSGGPDDLERFALPASISARPGGVGSNLTGYVLGRV